jgi:outer membrane protein assembly factor BamB
MLDDMPAPPAAPTPARSSRRASAPRPAMSRAPAIWAFDSGASAYGVYAADGRCWVGNEAGKVFAVDDRGEVVSKFRLPDGVKCIVSDGDWLYAGCDDGKVYDIGGKAPHVAYEIAQDVDIYWLDISDAVLAVSDDNGVVTTFNHEDESQWHRKSLGIRGWMVRCDEIGVYHGHTAGVTMYDWEDGRQIWHHETRGGVLFGWQEESTVYAGTGGGHLYTFSKKGELLSTADCDSAVFSCAAAPDGRFLFAADSSSAVYCFTADGTRLWKLATGFGVALSMQYRDERLYLVTQNGTLACVDASEAAIEAAMRGEAPEAVRIEAPAVEEVATAVETTAERGEGVVVECFREGGTLRVRVVGEGFDPTWHCQFPKGLREAGARYVVDEVRESARGGFYRARGNIRRLV